MTKKRIINWLKILLILYGSVGIALYYLQNRFLFHPEKLPRNYVFNFDQPFKEVEIPFNETDTLNMVQFFPKDSIRKGVVVYYHGNKDNIEHYAMYASAFTKHGYEVWMEDYPGFGKSTGERTEKKLYDQAMQVELMARSRYHPDSIIIYGKSLGTGIAAYVASNTHCKRLILESPYYSIPALFGCYAPIYPTSAMAEYKIPTHDFLGDVKFPVTIFHGTEDEIIPYRCANRLRKYLKTGDEFIKLEKGDHNNLNQNSVFRQKLDSILSL